MQLITLASNTTKTISMIPIMPSSCLIARQTSSLFLRRIANPGLWRA